MANIPVKMPRDVDTRALRERPKQWMPPGLLPTPTPEPGFSFRWVRTATLNNADPSNMTRMQSEGYEPVTVESQPHMKVLVSSTGNYVGCVEIQGLVLCKIPTEFLEQREKHYSQLAKSQIEAVDNNYMRESDPRMPVFSERNTKVSFGKGK